MKQKTPEELERISEVITDLFSAENLCKKDGAKILGAILVDVTEESGIKAIHIIDRSIDKKTIISFSSNNTEEEVPCVKH